MVVLHHKARCRNSTGSVCLFGLLCLLLACSKPDVEKPKPASSVRLRAFAEASPTRARLTTDQYAYQASAHGLDQWDLATKDLVRLTVEEGLPSNEVRSLAYDEKLEQLWIATDFGLTRYKSTKSRFKFSSLAPPADILGIKSYVNSVMVAGENGGVWVGVEQGLYFAKGDGGWSKTGIDSPVNALLLDTQNRLWIGTDTGVTWVDEKRVAHELSPAEGCNFSTVLSLSEYGSGVLVIAEGASEDISRVALAGPQGCVTYKVPSEKTWLDAMRYGDTTYVLGTSELYRVAVPSATEGDEEPPAGFKLPAMAKGKEVIGPAALQFEEVEQPVPNRVSHFAASGDHLLLATEHMGTMIWKPGDVGIDWLRVGDLTAEAENLSVACLAPDDCFIATGTKKLWHWNGTTFVDEGDLRRVHAVLTLKDGRIMALRDAPGAGRAGQAAIVLSTYEEAGWTEMAGVRIETPGKEVRVAAARQGPGGLVWLAIRYVQGRRKTVPFGVAAVDLEMGMVFYHRASFDKRLGRQGILPVPVDVTGIAFLGEETLWLSSSQGATRVVGEEVKTFIEADGLRSELLQGVVCTQGGMVYTASSRGLGAWDGETWTYPPEMRSAINDLAMGKHGRLWIATDRGLGVYDGSRVRRLDTRRGLLENLLLDVESDNYGRIWAMSASGFVLVSP